MARQVVRVLESLMAGQEMTPGELDDLLGGRVSEGLFLEYKHGDELCKNKPCRTIRQYLSGFANSAGGILVIGVDEATWSVTGCQAPGGGDLAEWASRCLTSMAPYFAPPPVLQVVKHPKGHVLIAAADRSLTLVPCVDAGEFAYYLRIHDQTLQAPEYLVSDLVLGRRQHPYLHIAEFWLSQLRSKVSLPDSLKLVFDLYLRVDNESVSWAEDVRLGIVGWVENMSGHTSLTDHLRSYIEIQARDEQGGGETCVPHHCIGRCRGSSTATDIEPFVSSVFWFKGAILPLRVNKDWYAPYTWRAAVYIASKGAPLTWYQLSLTVNTELLETVQRAADLPSESSLLQVERIAGTRPVVAWK